MRKWPLLPLLLRLLRLLLVSPLVRQKDGSARKPARFANNFTETCGRDCPTTSSCPRGAPTNTTTAAANHHKLARRAGEPRKASLPEGMKTDILNTGAYATKQRWSALVQPWVSTPFLNPAKVRNATTGRRGRAPLQKLARRTGSKRTLRMSTPNCRHVLIQFDTRRLRVRPTELQIPTPVTHKHRLLGLLSRTR